MTSYEPTMTYLPKGKVAHVLPFGSTPGSTFAVALCGTAPPWFDPIGWRGTGSQDEADHLKTLPICKRCERISNAS